MKKLNMALIPVFALAQSVSAAQYLCPVTTAVDTQHSSSGRYVGSYAPQSGVYAGTLSGTTTVDIRGEYFLDTSVASTFWTSDASGAVAGRIPSADTTINMPFLNLSSAPLGLDTGMPDWLSAAPNMRWPSSNGGAALHGLAIQRNFLKLNANSARRSHALTFAKDYYEYRLVGSTDSAVDGVNSGQLTLAGNTIAVEITTEYITPTGRANNDYCYKLFNNHNGYKGFEVWLRPVIHILGQNLDEVGSYNGPAGDYEGQIELYNAPLPTTRPVY